MYFLKYLDEYGKSNYYISEENGNPMEFKTKAEALAKAKELIGGEYKFFNLVVTKYYVVEITEQVVETLDEFKVYDDKETKTCILSATAGKAKLISQALEGVQDKFNFKIVSDKIYINGSRVVEFTYEEKKSDDINYNMAIAHRGNTFVIVYHIKDYDEVEKIVSYLNKIYGKDIVYFYHKRENSECKIAFTLDAGVDNFKKELFNLADDSFTVKYL